MQIRFHRQQERSTTKALAIYISRETLCIVARNMMVDGQTNDATVEQRTTIAGPRFSASIHPFDRPSRATGKGLHREGRICSTNYLFRLYPNNYSWLLSAASSSGDGWLAAWTVLFFHHHRLIRRPRHHHRPPLSQSVAHHTVTIGVDLSSKRLLLYSRPLAALSVHQPELVSRFSRECDCGQTTTRLHSAGIHCSKYARPQRTSTGSTPN